MKLQESFVQTIKSRFGVEADAFLSAIVNTDPIISVRFNERKVGPINTTNSVPWASNAMYLEKRPVFTLDPLFNVGAYYVQEASSMFLEKAFKAYVSINDSSVVLDLCASPGGKSTLLASLMQGKGLLVSNEVVSQRVAPLRENITKWGYANCVVTNSDPSAFGKCESLFDAILVDAPCSGEGMFRKDEQAVVEWSPDNVEMCAVRQKQILKSVYPSLKDGGILIYSTCTYNQNEDEENVKWICAELGGEVLSVDNNPEWGIVDSGLGYHFYPHKTKGEGFFLAVIRKNETAGNSSSKLKCNKVIMKSVDKEIKNFVINPSDYDFSLTPENMVIATPKSNINIINYLKSAVRVVQSGVFIAQLKGKDVIPAAPLALSELLNKENFECVDLDWQKAMAFLKKESFPLPDSPKGWLLVTYKKVPLGWLKNLCNRTNSGYPQEWHVRMQADPLLYTDLL